MGREALKVGSATWKHEVRARQGTLEQAAGLLNKRAPEQQEAHEEQAIAPTCWPTISWGLVQGRPAAKQACNRSTTDYLECRTNDQLRESNTQTDIP